MNMQQKRKNRKEKMERENHIGATVEKNEVKINWYPGHMTKTSRMIVSAVKDVDIVIELCDARAPLSTTNPHLEKLTAHKPRLILLNKCDLADNKKTEGFIEYFKNKGIKAIAIDSKNKRVSKIINSAIEEVLAELLERLKARGMGNRALRAMIIGIPNVGKSSLINNLCGGRRAKVEDRPGVTRGKQWVTTKDGLELLDTPGVLLPKFENQEYAKKIAFIGSINDDILDLEWLSCELLGYIKENYPGNINERYSVDPSEFDDRYELLKAIGKKRGMLMAGGVVDTERASVAVLDEFRGGKMGLITLDKLDEDDDE